MCKEYAFETKSEEYSRVLASEALDLPTRQSEADLLLKPSIRIGDLGTVAANDRRVRDGRERRWRTTSAWHSCL